MIPNFDNRSREEILKFNVVKYKKIITEKIKWLK
jgi:hypothetical protein